jgi:hypothetical protein
MILKFVDDNPNRGYAFNLYHCEFCGTIARENVWENPGVVYI